MIHHLKIWPGSFEAVLSGAKKHEIRDCNDRKFLVNDHVIYHEWVPDDSEKVDWKGVTVGKITKGHYTGRHVLKMITYISVPGSWGLPDNLCVFSIK